MANSKPLSISHWNIKGLHDPIFGCKIQSVEFLDSLDNYDINILTETWGCSHDITVLNFEVEVIKPNKIKSKKSGRSSGGILVLYKKHLKPNFEVISRHKNYIWFKLKDAYTFNTLEGYMNTLYICATYIPPESSPYFDDTIFDNVRDDMNNFSCQGNPIMICGDFNARTSNVNDFISISDKHCPNNSITTKIDTSRRNIDPELNSHGQKLIQLCKENNLRIGNGRCSGDSFGKCTFFSAQGHKSLVDYTFVSDSFLII